MAPLWRSARISASGSASHWRSTVSVCWPSSGGGVAGSTGGGAEPAPEPLVEGRDSEVAVLGLEGAHGHHRSVHRTGWLRRLPGGLGQGDVVAEEAEEAVEHADVQHLPAPGALPLVQGGGNGLDGIEPGHHIADREAAAQRRPAHFTGDTHHAGHRLGNQVEGSALGVATALAETRDTALDQARIAGAERLGAEAVLVED